MSLPRIKHPTFQLTLPIIGVKIKFRPFLVKEEKILLMAAQSGETADAANAMLQVLQNCLISPADLDIGTLPSTDAEYYFLKLRAKSINNLLELRFRDTSDQKEYGFELDLEELEPTFKEGHNPVIDIDGNVGIKLRYPTINMVMRLLEQKVDLEKDNYALVRECIEQIYDKKQTYELAEITAEELDEWIEQFPQLAKDAIRMFFETIPQLSVNHKYTNSNGEERAVTLTGLSDFFQYAYAT